MTSSRTLVALVLGSALSNCVSRTEVFEDIQPEPVAPGCVGGPLRCAFPELPELPAVSLEVHGDTALVSFAGVEGARDYRITALDDPSAVTVTPAGRVVLDQAVYRCAGDRALAQRPRGDSLNAEVAGLYQRAAAEASLGHVYLAPGTGRVAVRRLADPQPDDEVGAHVPSLLESRAARYVPEGPVADALLAEGYRDDGIAFYAPQGEQGTHPVHFWHRAPGPDPDAERLSLYLLEGDEYDALAGDPSTERLVSEFRALDEPAPGSVRLRRVLYRGGHSHDVLVAGEAAFERALDQGNRPLWRLAWPGLTANTTLVVEALDQGCPFLGVIESNSALGDTLGVERTTLDTARLGNGEVFVNGQHEASNRPTAIARSFVDAGPGALPAFEHFDSFDTFPPPEEFTRSEPDGDTVRYEAAEWVVEATRTEAHSVGTLLGQLWLGQSDAGGAGLLRVRPQLELTLERNTFSHVMLRANLPATPRRYPQLLLELGEHRLVVQTRGVQSLDLSQAVALELEWCQGRDWQPDAPCESAELAGRRLGDTTDERPWAPVPVVAELAGFDLPVRLDVIASTERVYLFLDERPAGCAVLPPGAVAPGPLTVAFGSVSHDSANDEASQGASAPHQFLRRHLSGRDARRFDDFGVSQGEPAPDWDHALYPCGELRGE